MVARSSKAKRSQVSRGRTASGVLKGEERAWQTRRRPWRATRAVWESGILSWLRGLDMTRGAERSSPERRRRRSLSRRRSVGRRGSGKVRRSSRGWASPMARKWSGGNAEGENSTREYRQEKTKG